MGEDRSYKELKSEYDNLVKRVTSFSRVQQNLINTRDSLDRELARFKAIQSFSENAIQAKDMQDFATVTVESIVEAFEIDCSALLSYDRAANSLKIVETFGFEEFDGEYSLNMDWIIANGKLDRGGPFIEQIDPEMNPWGLLGLCQVILCPYYYENRDLRGLVLGGRSLKKHAYYDEIKKELIPSFMVFTQQMSVLLRNFESKEYLDRTVQERTKELKAANAESEKINEYLQQELINRHRAEKKLSKAEQKATELSEFLKEMFGRYISPKVMNSLIENPATLALGGERRKVTIMITDLRGFTALSERLEPEQVVKMLNAYFEVMVKVVHQYDGIINEIIGDSLLIIFGAPQEMPDRAQRAIACAITMQNAMADVNAENRTSDLPGLEMGIGIHDTEVIVGNIGSSKRSKYSVVGSGVNQTSRIESYTVGGQILISESVLKETGGVLRIDGQRKVLPKGTVKPLWIYDIGGIASQYNLALEREDLTLVTLTLKLPIQCTILKGKHIGKKGLKGFVVRLSKKSAEIALKKPVDLLTDLKMNLIDVYEELAAKDFYGKVIERLGKTEFNYVVRFTSVQPEIVSYFLAHQQIAVKPVAE